MNAATLPQADAVRAAARPEISILVLSWNTLELTRKCLESIPAGIDDGTSYEVIVIDNDSRDGSAEMLATRTDVVLERNDRNVGYAAGVNQAYARARGRHVLLLNSDIQFEPGALSTLLRFLRDHPEADGVGPLYLNPDRTEQQHHFRLPTFGAIVGNANKLLVRIPFFDRRVRSYRMLDVDFTRPRPVEQPSASVLLLRREVLPDGLLMDEGFPIYFNDVELAFRLNQQGRTLWMTPDSVVVHEHGASTRQLGGRLARQHIGSCIRYLRATQPRYRVELYRALVLAQKLAVIALRRPSALSVRDLMAALRGDPGPVPETPSSRAKQSR